MTIAKGNVRRFGWWLVFAALTVANSGCLAVAAGAAGAGGAAIYAHYQGKDTNTFDADVNSVGRATEDALYDLAMPVVKETRDNGNSLTIKSTTGTGDNVTIEIEPETSKIPSDGARTKVSVRVAMFGDHDVSMRILHRIDYRVGADRSRIPAVATPGAANQPVAAAAPPGPVVPASANGAVVSSPVVPAVPQDPQPAATPTGNWRPAK